MFQFRERAASCEPGAREIGCQTALRFPFVSGRVRLSKFAGCRVSLGHGSVSPCRPRWSVPFPLQDWLPRQAGLAECNELCNNVMGATGEKIGCRSIYCNCPCGASGGGVMFTSTSKNEAAIDRVEKRKIGRLWRRSVAGIALDC